MQVNSLKSFSRFSMDTNSAPEYIDKEDGIEAWNCRASGTSEQEGGYLTNIESTEAVTETTSVPTGINKVIGARDFDDIQKGIAFRYNSYGNNQILIYDYATNTIKSIFTDITDTGGETLLPLDPQYYVTLWLINRKYLCWTDGQSSIGFTNIERLESGDYGTVTAEDLSMIKPQPMEPIVGYYSDDAGKASNFLKGKLFQFSAMWFGEEYTSSAWSTWSKRIIPLEEATPSVGDDVTKNNCIILSVPVGSDRVLTLNIAARYGNFDFAIIKSIDRADILALPDTEVDIEQQIFEAYDPTSGIYSFVFYNDSIAIPVSPVETDLAYDRVPRLAGCGTTLNGNIIGLSDVTEGYPLPSTSIIASAMGYDPNLTVPQEEFTDRLNVGNEENFGYDFFGAYWTRGLTYTGLPKEGDLIGLVFSDARNGSITLNETYTVPSSQIDNLGAVMETWATMIPNSSLRYNGGNSVTLIFQTGQFEGVQRAYRVLNAPGTTVSKSIHSFLDNSSYKIGLEYRDEYGRYFPLITSESIPTPSLAQINGQAVKLSWQISDVEAPEGAVDYQILLTKNGTAQSVLDVLGSAIDFKGQWNASTNTPTLVVNSPGIGDTYQVSTPLNEGNLGNGVTEYTTGSFVVNNGKSWDVVAKTFGDMASDEKAWFFKLNPLYLFNEGYAENGNGTVLTYDFTPSDRLVLHCYYSDPDTQVWINDPCVELGIIAYDPGSFVLKTTTSASIGFDDILGKNIYMRIVTPAQQTDDDSAAQATTVWYEVGERYRVVNGEHETLTGEITDGDVYYKTRTYRGALDPEVNYSVLAVDFNFSDFYISNFTSYGRPRTLYDELEETERMAVTRYSQNFILGSRNNGLTRFYTTAIYGEADRQTSSSYGRIGAMWMRGNVLILIQATNTGYVPVNISLLEDASAQQQYAISNKFLNDIRYNQSGNIGIGDARESFCYYDNQGWFIDPNRGSVIQIGLDGLTDISYRMSKYLKSIIQTAYENGRKMVLYYDRYYKEVVFCIQTEGGVLTAFKFNALSWNVLDGYSIAPAAITANNGSHSTVSYNAGTGVATYTPTTDYTGNDVATFSFNPGTGVVTKNVCLNWEEGTTDVNPFYFMALTDQMLSELVVSNAVLINGNTIPAAISITGGQYRINGGAWTSSPGAVDSGDIVEVRQTTSASEETLTTATLTVGAYSSDFDATTGNQDVDPIVFTALTEQARGAAISSNIVTISGNVIPANISISAGGEYRINGGSWVSTAGTVDAGDTVQVRQTSSAAYNTLTTVTLTVTGQTAPFNVTTVVGVATLNYSLVEQLTTFVDANLQIKINGTPIAGSPFVSAASGSLSIPGSSTLSVEVYSDLSSDGNNPKDYLQILKDSIEVYNDDSAVPVSPGVLLYSTTIVPESVYDVFATSDSEAIVNYFISQLASPYIDGNLSLKESGVDVAGSPFVVDASGTVNMAAGSAISSEAFSSDSPSGTDPTLRQFVSRDGAVLYDNETAATPGASLVYGGTVVGGSVYNINVSTFEGSPSVPSCPTRRLVIQACNSNALIDDNFDFYLNGLSPANYIGSADFSTPSYTGSVMIGDLAAPDIVSSDFTCPLVGMTAYYFDPALVVGGVNTIYMVNTQNNGNNNFGTIGVRNYELVGGDLENPCVIANLQYGYAPSGVDFELNFDYTACCPGD